MILDNTVPGLADPRRVLISTAQLVLLVLHFSKGQYNTELAVVAVLGIEYLYIRRVAVSGRAALAGCWVPALPLASGVVPPAHSGTLGWG